MLLVDGDEMYSRNLEDGFVISGTSSRTFQFKINKRASLLLVGYDGTGFWKISRKAFCVYREDSKAKINISETDVKDCHFTDVPVPFTANGVDAGFVATMESYEKDGTKVKGDVVASFRGTAVDQTGIKDVIRDILPHSQ